jgi:guanylate kinase
MDIGEKIANYTPSDATVNLVRTAKIALLVGIAGAGKDTVKRELLKADDFCDIVSHTTRLPRANNGVEEVEGKDYHFIDVNEAVRMIDNKEFVEVKYVHGTTIYGTSAAEIQKGHDEDKILVTDVDVQGVAEYKKLSLGVIAIFLLPPNYEIWRERLARRYESPEAFDAEWPKRRDSAITELEKALKVPYYHFIINDQLDETVRIANQIAHTADEFHRKDDEARLAAWDILDSLRQTT